MTTATKIELARDDEETRAKGAEMQRRRLLASAAFPSCGLSSAGWEDLSARHAGRAADLEWLSR